MRAFNGNLSAVVRRCVFEGNSCFGIGGGLLLVPMMALLLGVPLKRAIGTSLLGVVATAVVAVAIDAEGGLTDPVVARRTLERRGRPGHEKRADYDYLRERGVHMVAGPNADAVLGLRNHVPAIPIDLHGATAWVIRWDPEIMAALRERGVQFPDFPAELDRLIAGLDRLPDEEVERIWGQLRPFYFDQVEDPRAAVFEARLSR